MIKQLHSAANAYQSALDELADIDSREKKCKESLEKAAETGSIDDPATQRKIGDARMILDLCAGRRRVLKRETPALLEALIEQFREADQEWDTLLNKFIAFHANSTAALCGTPQVADIHSPALNNIQAVVDARRARTDIFNCAFADSKRGNPPGGECVRYAKWFCSHVRAHAKELGITLPDETKK